MFNFSPWAQMGKDAKAHSSKPAALSQHSFSAQRSEQWAQSESSSMSIFHVSRQN